MGKIVEIYSPSAFSIASIASADKSQAMALFDKSQEDRAD